MRSSGRILFGLVVCALTSASGQTRYLISTIAGNASLGDNGSATQAVLWQPYDIAVDATGNAYIADAYNNRIRKVTAAGTMTTIACTGVAGYSGDGGPAAEARCFNPEGVAVDSSGNVFFSDTVNQRVRKIALDGTISTIAGNGATSFSGDGGPATSASLNYPAGMLAYSGNLYIVDRYNNRIREVTPDGKINTVAGGGTGSSLGDGGPATQATLNYPRALAVDAVGGILIADTFNNKIRRFLPAGVITTIAGEKQGLSGDNGQAIFAGLTEPEGVAVGKNGTIYISDYGNWRIRAISNTGIISTIAGLYQGYNGDNIPAINAWVNRPQGMATDSQGNLYFADTGNNRVRMIGYISNLMTTFAGRGHYAGDNGPAVSAIMTEPTFLTADATGNLYVSDTGDYVVRKIDTTGKITTIAGTGSPGTSGIGGPATAAQLESPEGLAFDSAGNLYIVDNQFQAVRMISPGGIVYTYAGGNEGLAVLSIGLASPYGIAADSARNVYVADNQGNRVWQITPQGTTSVFLGNGKAGSSGDGGLATAAEVNAPVDVKVASNGTVYVAESDGNRVRAVSPDGIVSTLAYVCCYPQGLALDPSGNVIVSTPTQIFAVSPSGAVTLIAGQGGYGFSGDGGPALQAQLNQAAGLVTDAKGNIYFSDSDNNRIRKLTPDPVSQIVSVSGDQQTATVGKALPLPLVVQVNGASGLPFPGVAVTYAITSGTATLSAKQAVTGSDGKASVTLTLPAVAGVVTVSATVTGLPPVEFTATAVDVPSSITLSSGNNQTGVAGSTLQQPVAVKVYGVYASPLSGVTVTFSVTGGSATLNPASVPTGNDGSAATQVTLGSTAGPVTISASAAGLPPVTFSLTATLPNGPQIFAGGVVSAGLSTPPLQTTAPNAIVSIFGKNFAPAGTSRSVTGADLVNGMVPTNLAGVCVLFGTQRAPIFLVTPGQLNVQVPQVTVPGTPAVQVIANCDASGEVVSGTVNIAVQPASPEFFYASNNGTGSNPVAATDAVTGAAIALAHPGETVTLYATGLGLSSPAFAAGQLPPGEAQVSNVTVSIDGTSLPSSALQYAGVAPLNAGLYQLNIVLPSTLTAGDHTITISVSGSSSPPAYISSS